MDIQPQVFGFTTLSLARMLSRIETPLHTVKSSPAGRVETQWPQLQLHTVHSRVRSECLARTKEYLQRETKMLLQQYSCLHLNYFLIQRPARFTVIQLSVLFSYLEASQPGLQPHEAREGRRLYCSQQLVSVTNFCLDRSRETVVEYFSRETVTKYFST